MSRCGTSDFTDDEDSHPEASSPPQSDQETIDESSCVDSENDNPAPAGSSNQKIRVTKNKCVKNTNLDDEETAEEIISHTDSSIELEIHKPGNKKRTPENRKPSFKNISAAALTTSRNIPKENSSDSDDDIVGVRLKTKKNVIASESDSDTDSDNVFLNATNKLNESRSVDGDDSDSEIENIRRTLNRSRISSELNFGNKGSIVNSTLLATDRISTPKAGSKRLSNRSVDTPRILKHLKESMTPEQNTTSKQIQLDETAVFASRLMSQNNDLLTPRNVKEIIPSRSPSPSSSIEVLSESDDDIIDISSGDVSSSPPYTPVARSKRTVKQSTLDSVVLRKQPGTAAAVTQPERDVENIIEVSPNELIIQKEKIKKIQMELQKGENLLRTVNLDGLPDKGKLIKDKQAAVEEMLIKEVQKMSKMVVSKEDPPVLEAAKPLTWNDLQAKAEAVLPKTFGKRAMSTYNAQKALTMDRLQQLHGSLETCPKESVVEKDPYGLKVELMPHQKRALAWLKWREKQKPSGGILADDMGLGKTLTMISLMLTMKEVDAEEDQESLRENQPGDSSNKFSGGTLVVCPASLLNQWSGELERRTKRGLVSYTLYHGPRRETKPKRLAEYDMVITTYAIIMNELEKNGAVFRIKWRRIVIDEAHQIRNHKSQTSEAVCRLAAKSRWALTGTPVHNKELDMYALLKFLRCTPFDDLQVWKRWVGDKSTGGQERLHTVISSLMLRRTKAELIEKGSLQCMPERKWELVPVQLSKDEMDVYQKILLFSRTLFAQFLHQRAEKNQDRLDVQYTNFATQPNGPNQEYFKMRERLLRYHNVRDIKQHEILVLLLRLRQICCHPSLITNMLPEDMENLDVEENMDHLNILEELNKLALNDNYDHDSSNPAEGLANQENALGLKDAAKSLLNPSNPVFAKETISSKIKIALKVLKEKVVGRDDKAIIVSQWPSFLKLLAYHLEKERIPFDQLDGSIPVNKRMVMVDKFNDPNDKMKILLLSLTAGGVGLNLIGANHLFLLDLHWNPQLENQAQDRIYRVGQLKPVFVYKFMATDTIEKRILDLQEKKLDIANSMLTGTKQVINSKLSLEDLKLLFEM